MKVLTLLLGLALVFFILPSPAFAASSNPDITSYVSSTLSIITIVASAVGSFDFDPGRVSVYHFSRKARHFGRSQKDYS